MSSLAWDMPIGSMGECPLAGILNGALGEPEPWGMALGAENALQEARPSLPCKPITAMEAFYASQLAYRVPIAPAGAGAGISCFLCIAAVMISKL